MVHLELRWGTRDSTEVASGNQASSSVEAGKSGFIMSCSMELGVPLELWLETRGSSQVAMVNSELLSSFCSVNSVFLSGHGRELGIPLMLGWYSVFFLTCGGASS